MESFGIFQEHLDVYVKNRKTFYTNITQDVQACVNRSNFQDGILLVHTRHTTTGLTATSEMSGDNQENGPVGFLMQEDEPLLMKDLQNALDSGAKKFLAILPLIRESRSRILDNLPQDMVNFALDSAMSLLKPIEGYGHDNFDIRVVNMGVNERKNAEAHLKASMIKEFVLWSFSGGQLNLGQWQSITFWDFDPVGRKKRRLDITVIGQ